MSTAHSEQSLLAAAQALAGVRLGDLAARYDVRVPPHQRRAKGWVGELFELALGATAGNRPEPDFEHLGIELKSLPLNAQRAPKESTFVCSAPLMSIAGIEWDHSVVKKKLSRVLWIPFEADPAIEFSLRRIGLAFLWSPTQSDSAVLRADWEEHMEMIALGRIDEIDARRGQYLQLRPKAMNSRERTQSHDARGEIVTTNPRGFYLRSRFTRTILDHTAANERR